MMLKAQSATLTATIAVVRERRRISRDLHDSTIQPYIGLKLGLEALRLRLAGADPIAREVDELIAIAGQGINELRRYVGTLKHPSRRATDRSLVEGVRWQARNFTDLYGLRVDIFAEFDVVVSGRLFEELLHIVREALANVRRHTRATRAVIELRLERRVLSLKVENDRGAGARPALPFRPLSIEERAQELGGRVRVSETSAGHTVLDVQVPL